MKSKNYFTLLIIIFFGASYGLHGQEFFKVYDEISTNAYQWINIQAIHETSDNEYIIPHINITDIGIYNGLRWLEVDNFGDSIGFQKYAPPLSNNYNFWNLHLLKGYEYFRLVHNSTSDSLILIKHTALNDVIWEKSFSDVNYACFITSDKLNNVWLLYEGTFVNGDSLVLCKLNKDGDLIWQSHTSGNFNFGSFFLSGYRQNYVTTPFGGMKILARKYSTDPWDIYSFDASGIHNWVFETPPNFELSLLAVGADESTLILEKDIANQENLLKITPFGEKAWEISLADSTGWIAPTILGAVARKGLDFILIASVFDTLKAVHIRPDGSFGQRWELISIDHFFNLGFNFQAGLEDSNGNVLFAGIRSTRGFLAKLTPIETFPSAISAAIKQPPIPLHIFPNPATDKITVSLLSSAGKKDYKIILINALGETVLSQNSLEEKTEIAVDVVPPGIYFLNVFKDGVVFASERLVVNP